MRSDDAAMLVRVWHCRKDTSDAACGSPKGSTFNALAAGADHVGLVLLLALAALLLSTRRAQ
jgi:hypothetical protein